MTWFAIYDNATGRLISTGQSVAPDAELAAQGRSKIAIPGRPDPRGQAWNAATRQFDDIAPVKRKITMQQFVDRFTATELADLADRATVDKQARGFVEYLRISKAVDPNMPRFQAELDALVSAGVLAPVRPAELLAEG